MRWIGEENHSQQPVGKVVSYEGYYFFEENIGSGSFYIWQNPSRTTRIAINPSIPSWHSNSEPCISAHKSNNQLFQIFGLMSFSDRINTLQHSPANVVIIISLQAWTNLSTFKGCEVQSISLIFSNSHLIHGLLIINGFICLLFPLLSWH